MGSRQAGWTVNAALWGGILMLLVAAVALWGAQGAGGQITVWLFPRFAATSLALCGIVLVAQGLRIPERVRIWDDPAHGKDVLGFAAAATAYVALLYPLGFWFATALLVGGTAYTLGGGGRGHRLVGWLAFGLVIGLGFDALFVGVFHVPFPGGALWGEAPWRPWAP